MPARPTRLGRRRRLGRAGRHAIISALSFTLLLALAAGGVGYYEYHRLNGQIKRVDALPGKTKDVRQVKKQLKATNYLVIGSDSRAGDNNKLHDVAGARSDTTILIHVSKDRKHVTVVSIPRDTWMRLPDCTTVNNDFAPRGTVYKGQDDQFNTAFAIGGARCTIAAVQKLTGILVTHFLQIDFAGFQSVVNALGTISICSPEAVHDTYTDLHLKKGTNHLDGLQALHYVRMRHIVDADGNDVGDGSDLGRIKRQQRFLGIVLRQALSGRLLSNPFNLDSFLDALTKSITADKHTSIGDLRSLGSSMSGLDPKRVTFYTAPIKDADYTPPGYDTSGKVLLDAKKGRVLWDSIINDAAGVKKKKASPTSTTSPKPTTTVKANSNAADTSCSL